MATLPYCRTVGVPIGIKVLRRTAKPSLPSGEHLLMTRALIGLGSNVGDRLRFLQGAVKRLGDTAGVQVLGVSSVYETESVGPADQPWFLNAVTAVDTSLSPVILLDRIQAIERALGRQTAYRWGPRAIDLDILLCGDIQVRTATLVIPHAELCRRAFVMIPLLELDPDVVLPDGTMVSACLRALTSPQQVRFFAPPTALAP
jgi:2-amino-4-hydroxy-6-hydroxymethyldihydropteridine diphosphokinase